MFDFLSRYFFLAFFGLMGYNTPRVYSSKILSDSGKEYLP